MPVFYLTRIATILTESIEVIEYIGVTKKNIYDSFKHYQISVSDISFAQQKLSV